MFAVPAIQLVLASFLPANVTESNFSAADSSFILIKSALDLVMTPGLAFFYGGFTQANNVLNTMAMSFV